MTDQNGGGFELIRADQVKPTTVSWLWPERIAFGKLSLLVGNPGIGKSMMVCDIAARISAGRPLPGVQANSPPPVPGGVLLLSGEDDAADTLVPRLIAHGADLSRVQLLPPMYRADGAARVVNLGTDIEKLAQAIDATPNCRVLIIDPLAAFVGRLDSFKDSDVRSALTPLTDLAAKKNVAVLCVMHLVKREAQAIYRSGGSIAFSAASRAVWLLCKRRDPSRRLLVGVKLNLASDRQGALEFSIGENERGETVIDWKTELIAITADQALAEELMQTTTTQQKDRPINRAKDWLQNVLADSSKPSSWIRSEAKAQQISATTLTRAREDLGVVEVKIQSVKHWRIGNEEQESALAS